MTPSNVTEHNITLQLQVKNHFDRNFHSKTQHGQATPVMLGKSYVLTPYLHSM